MGWSRRIKKIKEYFSDENQPNLDISKLSEDNEKKTPFFNRFKKQKKSNKSSTSTNNKKRNNIFLNFRRRSTIQIIKHLENKNIFNLFFYTDVSNITLILEQGIKPSSQIKLLPKQEYIVWTYLEHATYLELELGNSTRHFFWKWCAEQNVDVNKIAIISVDIHKLFQSTTKDWGLNVDTNRVQIYETIPVEAIDWILVKDRKMFRLAKLYIDNQRLKLKLFQGNNGNITLGSD
ncbi:MAG: acetyltransferase [Spiroplasma sp. WSS]|uniref:acetyltransferase n=1 Tax=unclassified Spiroplasma TaxID=2637901 RepID=UPI0012208A7A|nr:acetyltransferase [Spiroplasma endosymbiont of Lariophagus distinguendus]TLF28479.1 MAG: acetyltransferase [Spiroplasma sp. WSS]